MKKKVKAIAWILFVCLAIAVMVFYAIKPSETKAVINDIWGFLNKPLPIVGMTTLAVLFFTWKVIVQTKYGKKAIEKFKERCEELERLIAQEHLKAQEERDILKIENKLFQKNLIDTCTEICDVIPNIKVKRIGEKLKGIKYEKEEKVDANPKKE